MQAYLVGALVFAVLVSLFAIQNIKPVDISFLTWQMADVPLILVILVSALIGAAVLFLLGAFKQLSSRRKIKDLRRKNAKLEEERNALQTRVDELTTVVEAVPEEEPYIPEEYIDISEHVEDSVDSQNNKTT